MESLITDVNWVAVIVGAVAAFSLGMLWYSDKMFAEKWREGKGIPAVPDMPMMPGMLSQAVGTFLLAWVIGVTETTNSLALAILIAVTIAVIIKANGFFGGKSKYAIFVESGYIIAMVVIMILAHAIL